MQTRSNNYVNYILSQLKNLFNQVDPQKGWGYKINILESIELYLTYEELKNSIQLVEKSLEKNPNMELEKQLFPFISFLQHRWDRIQKSQLAYYLNPTLPLNAICWNLAEQLAAALKGYYFHSMNENVVEYELKELKKDSLPKQIKTLYVRLLGTPPNEIEYQTSHMQYPLKITAEELEMKIPSTFSGLYNIKDRLLIKLQQKNHVQITPSLKALKDKNIPTPSLIRCGHLFFLYNKNNQNESNIICLDHDDLNQYMDKSPLQLLMPTISIHDQFTTSIYALTPTQIILSSHQSSLVIDINACIQSGVEDGIFKYTCMSQNSRVTLTKQEKEALSSHSKETKELIDAINARVSFRSRDKSALGHWKRLVEGLRAGGVHNNKGATEFKAGTDANLAIADFYNFFSQLRKDEKQKVFPDYNKINKLKDAWNCISNPSKEETQVATYCVEVLAGEIESELQEHEEKLKWIPTYLSDENKIYSDEEASLTAAIQCKSESLAKALNSTAFQPELMTSSSENNQILLTHLNHILDENKIEIILSNYPFLYWLLEFTPAFTNSDDAFNFVLLKSSLQEVAKKQSEKDNKNTGIKHLRTALTHLSDEQKKILINIISNHDLSNLLENLDNLVYLILGTNHKEEAIINNAPVFSTDFKLFLLNKVMMNKYLVKELFENAELIIYFLMKCDLNSKNTQLIEPLATLVMQTRFCINYSELQSILKFLDTSLHLQFFSMLHADWYKKFIGALKHDELTQLKSNYFHHTFPKRKNSFAFILECTCLYNQLMTFKNSGIKFSKQDNELLTNMLNSLRSLQLNSLQQNYLNNINRKGSLYPFIQQYQSLAKLNSFSCDFKLITEGICHDDYHLFKIIIFGNSNHQLMIQNNLYNHHIPTSTSDFFICWFSNQHKIVKSQIWLIPPSEQIRTPEQIRTMAFRYRGAHCAIILADLSKSDTHDCIESYMTELVDYPPKNILKVVLGFNEDQVVNNDIQSLLEGYPGVLYISVPNINNKEVIIEAFQYIISCIYANGNYNSVQANIHQPTISPASNQTNHLLSNISTSIAGFFNSFSHAPSSSSSSQQTNHQTFHRF